MTYRLLKAYLPSDIVDYCLMNYIAGSKNYWKSRFNKSMRHLQNIKASCNPLQGMRIQCENGDTDDPDLTDYMWQTSWTWLIDTPANIKRWESRKSKRQKEKTNRKETTKFIL